MENQKLTLEQQAILQEFEDGRLLADVTNTPGWQRVLDIMEDKVAKAEYALMRYDGVDKEMLTALHRRARTMREFFQDVQADITARISAGRSVPDRLNRPAEF